AIAWNRIMSTRQAAGKSDLVLGYKITEGQVSNIPSVITANRRTEHIAVLGKTGTGKSSLLKHLVLQDIAQGRGFVFFDIHGDAQSFFLAAVAEQERIQRRDLSNRLIVIEPADSEFSVGLNVLDRQDEASSFVQISELA